MLTAIYNLVSNPQVLFATFSAVAVFGTILTTAAMLFEGDRLAARIKTVALEREKIRARERAKLVENQKRVKLRNEAKPFMRQVVESFNLKKALADERTTNKLRMAGYRGQAPLVVFLFARLVLPLIFFVVAIFYLFAMAKLEYPWITKILIAVVVAYAGFYAPNVYVTNVIKKRQTAIRRAWPDALDLLLICVESGMSAEAAFHRVSEEIGAQSVELAEELTLTTAELSYLQERRQAYENLGARTGLESVKSVMTSLIQAERYGTPLAQSLRVLAQENRDQRLTNAEKKAAQLPPKLTVPMILFFLPVLFGVLIGPAAIQVTHAMHH
jgi:tight adherence protein C